MLEGRKGRRHELLPGQATLDGRFGGRSGRVREALMIPIPTWWTSTSLLRITTALVSGDPDQSRRAASVAPQTGANKPSRRPFP